MSDTRVFVIQEGPHNYLPAEKFGEVEFITGLELSPIKNSKKNESVYSDITKSLSKYRPGTDYILPSGNPATVAMVFLTMGKLHPNQVHLLLRWDSMSNGYVMHHVSNL